MGFELPQRFPYERLFPRLKDEGYLSESTYRTPERVIHIELTPYGREVAREDADPIEETHADLRRVLASESFERAYPAAFKSWAAAEEMLFGANPEAELGKIGFNLRDATQAFASALVEEYPLETPEPSVTQVTKRLRAVIHTYRPRLGKRRSKSLDAMVNLWEADIDLIQRQTHANEKDKPLTVNDGRRVVFLTMFLMVEFATILDAMDEGPAPATLEPG